MFGYRKESRDETWRRLLKLADKDIRNKNFNGPPVIDGQTAFNELVEHFLGKDWYVVDPLSTEQVNLQALFEIERVYKKWVKKGKRVKKKGVK